MDWLAHHTLLDNVPFDKIATYSTPLEPRPSKTQLIDSSFSTYSSEEPFQQNLFLQPSYDLLASNPSDVHQAGRDHTQPFLSIGNESQHIAMCDDLSRNNSMPTRPIIPRSIFEGGQLWATGTTSGLLDTHGRPERIKSLVCKWENCRKPPFQSKGTLMRHIDTQHIAPRSFKCPDQSCNRFFSLKDNMEEHVRRVPWVRV